MAISNKKA